MDKPLIFTTKGNVPEDTLDYTQSWENHIESIVTLAIEDGKLVPKIEYGGYMVFNEMYHDKETRELVKKNSHVCMMKSPEMVSEKGELH